MNLYCTVCVLRLLTIFNIKCCTSYQTYICEKYIDYIFCFSKLVTMYSINLLSILPLVAN